MKTFVVLSMTAATLAVLAGETPKNPGLDANAAFARLKALAGEWEGNDLKMGKLHVTYEVVSGGSAVLERFTAEKMPPGSDMVTVYHQDGDRLLLTHYCMAQNQPRMRATRFDPASGELEFDMLDATNLKPGGGHMHSARFHFTDDKRFSSEWKFMEGGQGKFTETAEYRRIR
jgi:hypothetical protein